MPVIRLKKVNRAAKALWQYEKAQDSFNNAVNELSDAELAEFCKETGVTMEMSAAKERIQKFIESSSIVDEKSGVAKQ